MNYEAQYDKDLAVFRAIDKCYNAVDDSFDPYKFQLELIKFGYIVMKL